MSKTMYPDKKLLEERKLERLKISKGKCEACGKIAQCIHHIDGTKNNHELKNLIWLCYNCHNNIHKDGKRSPKGTSKYLRLYNKTFAEIFSISGLSDKTVWMILNYPKKVRTSSLNKFIKNTGIELEDLIQNTVPKD